MSSRSISLAGLALLITVVPAPALASASALSPELIINGWEVVLDHELLPLRSASASGQEELLVPLEELTPYLGVELTEDDEGEGFLLRWGLGREARLPRERLHFHDGEAYFPLAALAELIGARLLEFPDSIYLFLSKSELHTLSYNEEGLRLGFSRLTPFEVDLLEGEVRLEFSNSVMRIAPQTARYSFGPVAGLKLRSEPPDRLILELELRRPEPEAGEPRLRLITGFTTEGYWIEVRFQAEVAEWPVNVGGKDGQSELRPVERERLQLSPWLSYHRLGWQTAAGPVRVDYLLAEDYRAHYWLRAAIPSEGLGALDRLEELVRAHGGVAGINANFFDPQSAKPIGLLISEGQLLSPPYGERAALGIDLFGRAFFFQEGRLPFIPLRDAISAGPRLLKGGEIALDPEGEGFSSGFASGRAARSALGITKAGDLIMLIVKEPGLTLDELALLLRELRAVEALALDGGSSASLVFRQGWELHSLGSREIAVGLVLIPK